jgi:hypothetical protein
MAEAEELSQKKIKQHIEEMKAQIFKLTGDPECLYLGGLTSLRDQERFLERVLSMEEMEEKPLIRQLENAGVRVPSPEDLDDAKLHEKLWDVIHAMALAGHYLTHTDHLSDRELYELLWTEILQEPTSVNPDTSTASCHIDILGGCSDEDLKIRLQYYADDDERDCWESEFEDDEMPPKKPLPYDRDRHLPVPSYGRSQSEDIC